MLYETKRLLFPVICDSIFITMKKLSILICTALLSGGCTASNTGSASASKQTEYTGLSGDAYENYASDCAADRQESSWTAAVKSSYTMGYSDDSTDLYTMDGTIEAQDTDGNARAHTTQHIKSNGLNSELEGWYYDGRLYNTYNNVNYYEDMSFVDLGKTMLVPLNVLQFPEDAVASIRAEEGSDGSHVYTITLKDDQAADLFSSRYDSYGLQSYDGYEISENQIVDTFDAEGHFQKEEASFTADVTVQDQKVSVKYDGSVSYIRIGQTEVAVSDDMKNAQSAYTAYTEIDPSGISTEAKDDSAEATAAATFRKRLINRLGYETQDNGTLRDTFNENQTYVIDFDNTSFQYSNYSIVYVYNWKSDTGAMSGCTYDFKNETASSSCEDTTVDTIRDVKNYLQMELYYCGLSLEDLQAEANQ
jgi:hypothetical protein